MDIKSRLSVLAILIISALFPAFAAITEPVDDQQMDALLEEEISWLQAESVIYSAARREQLIMDTASAVFVLSNEDIRRSGVTSVPEALRRVPGLQKDRHIGVVECPHDAGAKETKADEKGFPIV